MLLTDRNMRHFNPSDIVREPENESQLRIDLLTDQKMRHSNPSDIVRNQKKRHNSAYICSLTRKWGTIHRGSYSPPSLAYILWHNTTGQFLTAHRTGHGCCCTCGVPQGRATIVSLMLCVGRLRLAHVHEIINRVRVRQASIGQEHA